MLRVNVTINDGAKKPKARHVGMVSKNYDALIGFISAKLRINRNKLRIFVCSGALNATAGTEITKDSDLDSIMVHDILFVGTKGEDYRRYGMVTKVNKDVPPPPRYPHPGNVVDNEKMIAQLPRADVKNNKKINSSPELHTYPILSDSVIGVMKKVISNDNFIMKDCGEYISFDYGDDAIFPPLDKNIETHLLRECRGLILSPYDGRVLARRFEKFFSIDEVDETSLVSVNDKIANASSVRVYEKIDGSLVSPILLDNNIIIWATRRDRIIAVEEFYDKNFTIDEKNIIHDILHANMTPLFEYCSKSSMPGAIYHDSDSLTLLAVRDNITGEYHDIDKYNLKQATCVPFTSLNDLLTNNDSIEGYVIYADNCKYKVKTKWYKTMVRATQMGGISEQLQYIAKELNTLETTYSFKLLQYASSHAALNDEIISYISRDEAQEINSKIWNWRQEMLFLSNDIETWVSRCMKRYSLDDVIKRATDAGWDDFMIRDVAEGKHISDKIRSLIGELARKRLISVYTKLIDMNTNVRLKRDNIAPKDVRDHIINTYLPKFLSRYTIDNTMFIDRFYTADEGKIKGMWEKFTDRGIHDLRIDLQPPRVAYDDHHGDSDHALILFQYGKRGDPNDYGGLLLPTNIALPIEKVYETALDALNTGSIIMQKRCINANVRIYCDLDGVLVDFEKGVLHATGRYPHEQNNDKMWQRIKTYSSFWEKLQWMPDGKQLWKYIEEYNPIILTGVPRGTKKHVKGKVRWVNDNLDIHDEKRIILCESHTKSRHSMRGHVLIDDDIRHRDNWEARGGIFVHHQNVNRTLYELGYVLNKSSHPTFNTDVDIDHDISYDLPQIHSGTVYIDSEWVDEKLSIMQMMVDNTVHIIDCLNNSDYKNILTNSDIRKVGYGISEKEVNILGCNICNYVDVQDHYCLINNTTKRSSIESIYQEITGKFLHTSVDHKRWLDRPLSDDQVRYAANDCLMIKTLYAAMNMYNVPQKDIKCVTKQISVDDEIKLYRPLSINIFLNDTSKNMLMTRYIPLFETINYDTIIIRNNPTQDLIQSSGIGRLTNVTITHYGTTSSAQYLSCNINDEAYTMVISHKAEYVVGDMIACDNINLKGTIGVYVEDYDDPLAVLTKKIRDKISKFKEDADTGENIKFHPRELSPRERSVVHEYAKNNNMESRSIGVGDKRRLVLTMGKKRYDGYCGNTRAKRHRITNLNRVMTFVTDNTLNRRAGYMGNTIKLHNDSELTGTFIVILRGLPGSGKSHLARYISAKYDAVICSADDYFTINNKYTYDRTKLNRAHDYWRKKMYEMLSQGRSVIIDNTNACISHYNDIYDTDMYDNILLYEIHCPDMDTAIKFAKRNRHNVPLSDIINMYQRWETDDRALFITNDTNVEIEPIICNEVSFDKFLTDKNLVHTNKKRNKTHMICAIGSRPVMFIDLPHSMRDEFYDAFLSTDDPKYIAELITDVEKFRFFLDIDISMEKLPDEEFINDIFNTAAGITDIPVYITSCEATKFYSLIKMGYHLHFHDLIVDKNEAMEIRDKIADALSHKYPEHNWDSIIDNTVYNSGCRMLGSRKVKSAIDVGRVYHLVKTMNTIDASEISKKEAMKLCSVHV